MCKKPLKKLPILINEKIVQDGKNQRSIRLMFQDEARFGRINEPSRCWAPEGIRPNVPCQIIREYTYAYAAVSPHDGVMDSLILPEVNSEAMSVFLAEVSARHADELILMVIDGAGWHRALDLRIPDNISIIQLPPYSPELNPAEHIWDEIREKWFKNKVFKDLDAVEDNLVNALLDLENDVNRVLSITNFNWIKSIFLNAT
jgi:transposase